MRQGLPSALSRSHGDGLTISEPELETPKRASAAKLAMLSADQLKAYYKRTGQWQEPDWQAIADLQGPRY